MTMPASDISFRSAGVFVRRLSPADRGLLTALCESCADYFEMVTGLPPGPDDVEALYAELPEALPPSAKILLGIFAEGSDRLVGVIDALWDYPAPGQCYVGLLLVEPTQRKRGLGATVYHAFEEWAYGEGAASVRLGVVEGNHLALKFWRRLGFEVVDSRGPRRFGLLDHTVLVLTRSIPRPARRDV